MGVRYYPGIQEGESVMYPTDEDREDIKNKVSAKQISRGNKPVTRKQVDASIERMKFFLAIGTALILSVLLYKFI